MTTRLHALRARYVTDRFISPGTILLYAIVLGYMTFTQFHNDHVQANLDRTQSEFIANAYKGCQRTNATNAALLDLGKIIRAARNQTSTSPAVRRAASDYLRQVKRLDSASPTSRALADLAVLIGGDKGQVADPRDLVRAEDDFIAKAKLIEQPRDCAGIYKP